MILFSLILEAFPCAGLIHEPLEMAESDAQEVIFTIGENTTVDYRVSFYGDATDFGWIIPIFGDFVSLQDGNDDDFDNLLSLTQPQVQNIYSNNDNSTQNRGCREKEMALDAGGENDYDSLGVTVVSEGFTGNYEYTIVSADDPEGLSPWLELNGWEIGTTEQSINYYAAEDSVQFALIRLSDVTYDADTQTLPPVSITYTGNNMRFPAMMALGGEDEVRTRIYIKGDEAATVSGWTTEEWDTMASMGNSAEELFSVGLREIGGSQPGYMTVFSGDIVLPDENVFVTRFETIADPSAHTLDSVFSLDGGSHSATTEITLYEEDANSSQSYLIIPFILLGFGWSRRK
jgi:hypothetical protein